MALSERAKAANERSRQMHAQACINFTGIQNTACKAGIAYDTLRIDGTLKHMPCLPGLGSETQPRTCPLFRVRTPEEIAAEETEEATHWEKLKLALKVASEWRIRPKPTKDRAEVVECPCCHGRLHLSQSSYNGHVHGQCETEGCVSWME